MLQRDLIQYIPLVNMAIVLSRQTRYIWRKLTAQYKRSQTVASNKMARVLSRQRRSIRRKTTAQYKMSAKPPYKKSARVPSRQRRSIRRKTTAQYTMSKKVASKIGESPVHVSIGFVSCNGGTVLRNQKKCDKHEEISPQERNEDRWKKMNAKPA